MWYGGVNFLCKINYDFLGVKEYLYLLYNCCGKSEMFDFLQGFKFVEFDG